MFADSVSAAREDPPNSDPCIQGDYCLVPLGNLAALFCSRLGEHNPNSSADMPQKMSTH